jgi:hypothetical protein
MHMFLFGDYGAYSAPVPQKDPIPTEQIYRDLQELAARAGRLTQCRSI